MLWKYTAIKYVDEEYLICIPSWSFHANKFMQHGKCPFTLENYNQGDIVIVMDQ